MKNTRRLFSFFFCFVFIFCSAPVFSFPAQAAVSFLSYNEALEYFDFTPAVNNWNTYYHGTVAQAKEQILNGTSKDLIIRLGTLARDLKQSKKSISVTNAFRPASYQEALCLYNYSSYFTWNSSKCKETNSYLENLKCWEGSCSDCAKPGASNHNTGESMDVGGWLRNIAISTFNNNYSSLYGVIKNVSSELWHVSLNGGGANKSGYDRYSYALSKGYEITYMPCAKNTSGYIKKGANVAEIQKKLNSLGYTDDSGKKLTVDGIFGDRMEQAVKKFQKANGLTVDGICGANTLNKLFKVVNVKVSVEDMTVKCKQSDYAEPVVITNEKYTITYKSSSPEVVSVSSDGRVTANLPGSAKIRCTVTTASGETASCSFRVKSTIEWWQWILIIITGGLYLPFI